MAQQSGSSGTRRAALSTACAVHAVQDGLYASVYVLLPVITPVFALSYSQVGLARAAFSSAMTLLQIPSGMLAERLGERVLLVVGLVCSGLGFVLLAAAPGIAAVFAGLFVAGVGAAFQHAPSSSLIARLFRDHGLRPALGAYNAAGDVGKLAFAAAFSMAIGFGIAWQHTVAGFGVVALASALASALVLGRIRAGARPVAAAADPSGWARLGWGIRDRKGFAGLTAIVFVDLAVQSSFLTFVALLMAEKQVPTGLAALAVVLTLGGGVCGKLGCGFLSQRLGAKRSLIVVQCLTAAGIAAAIALPAIAAFAVLPFLGVVLQGSSTITYGSVADLVHPERQSRGFAFIYSVSSAAGIMGPVAFGAISDGFGLAPAMAAMAALVLVSVPLADVVRAGERTRGPV